MKLRDILSEDRVKIPLEKTEKQDIIQELVGLISRSLNVDSESQILQAVLEREAVMSTGVGDEVAIPHAKTEGVEDIAAAFGITKEPVEFDSLDDKPVRLVWLIVGPQDKTGPHLKALSRISRLMHKKEFRERLIHTQAAKDLIEQITDEEEKYFE
ncbi:PTS sugar transporter subunit IIA [bacterium]|nr:PTS sugar transporter subunit IIA [bacterium]